MKVADQVPHGQHRLDVQHIGATGSIGGRPVAPFNRPPEFMRRDLPGRITISVGLEVGDDLGGVRLSGGAGDGRQQPVEMTPIKDAVIVKINGL